MTLTLPHALSPDEVEHLVSKGCIVPAVEQAAVREASREYQSVWRAGHREKIRLGDKKYRQTHRKQRNEQRRNWWRRNLERNRERHKLYMRQWRGRKS